MCDTLGYPWNGAYQTHIYVVAAYGRINGEELKPVSNSADDTPNSDSSIDESDDVLDLTEEVPADAEGGASDGAESGVEDGEEEGDHVAEEHLRETIQTNRADLERLERGEISEEVPSAAMITPREPVGPETVDLEEEETPSLRETVDEEVVDEEAVDEEVVDEEPIEPEPLEEEEPSEAALSDSDSDDFSAAATKPLGEEPIEPDPLDPGELEREVRSMDRHDADRSEDSEAEEVAVETEELDVDSEGGAESGESDEPAADDEEFEADEEEGSEEPAEDVDAPETTPDEEEASQEERSEPTGEELEPERGVDVGEPAEGEEGEVYETVKMEAVDRSAIEREGQIQQLEQTLPLLSSRFAPEIIVSAPRELVSAWRVETGELESSEESAPESQPPGTPPEAVPSGSKPTSNVEDEGDSTSPPATPTEGQSPPSPEDVRDPAPREEGRTRTPPSTPAQEVNEGGPDSAAKTDKRVTQPNLREDSDPPATPPGAQGGSAASSPPPQREEEKDEELSEIVEELVEGEEEEPRGRKRGDASALLNGEWVEKVFGELFLATVPDSIERRTAKETNFIEASLELGSDDKILDLACGYGRHTLELAGRGYDVVGFDLSKPLLEKGLAAAKRKSLDVNFFHGDMRSLEFDGIFDAVFCWQSSFGYYEDRTNANILARINRSLQEGGQFLLDIMNRDYVIRKMPHRIWWEGRDCIFLEEGEFDFDTSVLHVNRSYIYDSGRPPIEQNWYIRLYSRHEIIRLLEKTGFEVTEISGALYYRGHFIGRDSPQLIVRAEAAE